MVEEEELSEEEEEKDGEKLKMMANAVMEIQKRIIMSKDPQSKEDVKSIINQMKGENESLNEGQNKETDT